MNHIVQIRVAALVHGLVPNESGRHLPVLRQGDRVVYQHQKRVGKLLVVVRSHGAPALRSLGLFPRGSRLPPVYRAHGRGCRWDRGALASVQHSRRHNDDGQRRRA